MCSSAGCGRKPQGRRSSRARRAPSGGAITLLIILPLVLLLSYSFAPGGSTRADFSGGLTLENYADILGDFFYVGIVLRTIGIGVVVTVAAILIGWPLAFFLWRAPERWKTLLTVVVVAPLLISIPVRNYGWMVLLGDQGVLNSLLLRSGLIAQPLRLMYTDLAAIVGLTHVLMPFVVLSVQASLERIGPSLSEAARTLGASPARTVRHVVLPLSAPGLLAGGLLVFCVATSSYVTPAIMGPSGARYAAILIYQQFVSVFDWPRGATIAALLLLATLAVVLAALAVLNRRYNHLLRGA